MKFLDSGIRRDDESGIDQGFLRRIISNKFFEEKMMRSHRCTNATVALFLMLAAAGMYSLSLVEPRSEVAGTAFGLIPAVFLHERHAED